jgi:transposase
MRRGRALEALQISTKERAKLTEMVEDSECSKRLRTRARIVLLCATGASNLEVAKKTRTFPATVIRWRTRFLKQRIDGLYDDSRSGRPAKTVASAPLVLSDKERTELEGLAARRTTNQAQALRSRIVLSAGTGKDNLTIASEEGICVDTARKWRKRFAEQRLDGLRDEWKPGTTRRIMDEDVERVIVKTLESIPCGATHWSNRSMAKEVGISRETVGRIWRAFGLQPHRVETFKLSSDPYFIDKVRDIVGLYLDPPEKAAVLCVDEKSQIQALDRTQPILPLRPGVPENRTHDYERNGTTSLFAALNQMTGKVIGKCFRKHRTAEFRKFLDLIDKNVPSEMDIHLVLDNYGTHKTALIHKWLMKRPRFHLHFTPTSASWINLVERWFGELTEKCVRRGTFRNTRELEQSIYEYIDGYNEDSKPFKWVKTADEILESI